jgi:ribosomal protein L22
MSEDENNETTSAVDSTEEAATATGASSVEPTPEVSGAPVEAEAEQAAEAEPKPARKPRAAAKPTAEATATAVADEADAPAEKPKRTRTAKPKADEAAKAEKPATPSKPAPTRRREAREPGAAVPVVRAQAKYVRSSARKARLVCDNIRGKSVEDARAILAHTPRAVARDWSKLLESAVANAEHNHELVGEDLVIKSVHADEGPTIKRFRPRAMGRASKIRKRTAHLTILLTPKN